MLNHRWTFAVWFPFALVSCACAAYLFIVIRDGLPIAPGPGGGGGGLFFLVVWFLRLLALLTLAACFFLRPRGEAWNIRAVVISTLVWGSIFAAVAVAHRWANTVTVHVRAVDTAGRPLPDVRLEYRWGKRGALMRYTEDRGSAVTDAAGTATFRVSTFDTLYVHGDEALRPTHELAVYSHVDSTRSIVHSKDGRADRSTYSATVPRASELNMSMEFDPPNDR